MNQWSVPHFRDARDDDGALLHRRLELLFGRLVQLSDGGFSHGVGAIQHQQLGVRGGQSFADGGPEDTRLLWDTTAWQLRLDGHRFDGRIWRNKAKLETYRKIKLLKHQHTLSEQTFNLKEKKVLLLQTLCPTKCQNSDTKAAYLNVTSEVKLIFLYLCQNICSGNNNQRFLLLFMIWLSRLILCLLNTLNQLLHKW